MKKLLLPLIIVISMFLFSCTQQDASPPPAPPVQMTVYPLDEIPLSNLDPFNNVGANWQLASSAYVDPGIEKGMISGEAGSGVLINAMSDQAKSHLFTQMEHGDIEVELDFMMSKGSNAGIYLQSRYEIQMFDSWGVENPTHADCGGIYQRWDENRAEGAKGYEGHPPRINASRAPGLWQHYRIVFKAPTFDESGQKTSNAAFVLVEHNGVEIHRNVELTGPTRAAAFSDEAVLGPIMIQGDHGPVAIRNFRYRKLGDAQIKLSDISYKVYDLPSNNTIDDMIPDFSTLVPEFSGTSDSLSHLLSGKTRNYGMLATGKMEVPTDGLYLFELKVQGGAKLFIDGELAVDHDGEHEYTGVSAHNDVELTAGSHTFELQYRKQHRGWKTGLVLFAEGPEIKKHALHAPGSARKTPPYQPLELEVSTDPIVHRGFVMHEGSKRTHSVSVGHPSGIHFNYDLNQASLLNIWSGDFVDIKQMWVGRGEPQLAIPMGASLAVTDMPNISPWSTIGNWPDSISATQLTFKGYRMNKADMPVFKFKHAGLTISDELAPGTGGRSIERQISAEGEGEIWTMLAQGSSIEVLPNGMYGINGMEYYLEVKSPASDAIQLKQMGQQTIMLARLTSSSPIQTSIVW